MSAIACSVDGCPRFGTFPVTTPFASQPTAMFCKEHYEEWKKFREQGSQILNQTPEQVKAVYEKFASDLAQGHTKIIRTIEEYIRTQHNKEPATAQLLIYSNYLMQCASNLLRQYTIAVEQIRKRVGAPPSAVVIAKGDARDPTSWTVKYREDGSPIMWELNELAKEDKPQD